MTDTRLLEAAQRLRQGEQVASPRQIRLDAPDSWGIAGPDHCLRCGGELDMGTLERHCEGCRSLIRPAVRTCGIDGCCSKARANGRCRRHTHGDDEWWGWRLGAVRAKP